MAADARAGKTNLVVVLGKERARWGYLAMIAAAYLLVLVGVVEGILPLSVLLIFASLPIAVYATLILFRHYSERSLIKANSSTILLHLVLGLLLTAGLFFQSGISSLLH